MLIIVFCVTNFPNTGSIAKMIVTVQSSGRSSVDSHNEGPAVFHDKTSNLVPGAVRPKTIEKSRSHVGKIPLEFLLKPLGGLNSSSRFFC
jgi:hypothetical protein